MKPIKSLFQILKGFGIKKYLLILFVIAVTLVAIYGAYYLAALIFQSNKVLGIVAAAMISLLIVAIQLEIVKHTERNN